jgi:acyl dehydratase
MSESAFPEHVEAQCGPVTAVDLALYAAASGDHNPLHLDMAVANAAGFEKPIVHGMLTMAYAGRMLTEAFGPIALLSLSTRFIGVAKLGETVTMTGARTGQSGGTATYSLTARSSSGTDLLSGLAKVGTRTR